MLTVKRFAGVAPEVDLGECTLPFASPQKQIRQNPLWLWNSEETSPEIPNRDACGLKKGHVSAKKLKYPTFPVGSFYSHLVYWSVLYLRRCLSLRTHRHHLHHLRLVAAPSLSDGRFKHGIHILHTHCSRVNGSVGKRLWDLHLTA